MKKDENKDYLTVFYLDEQDEVNNIIGFYNEDSKTVNFRTDHLSVFFVTLNPASFKDNNVDWAKRFIDSMADKGIVSGSNEHFKPRDMVTRAEFVTMIINALRINQIEYENQFVDVKKEDWFSHMVATGFYNQIISGYGNQKFGPYDNITREQMAVIIANVMQEFMGMERIGDSKRLGDIFSDSSDISQYAKESIISAYRYGIVSGRGEGFSPKAHMTRAEAATVIYKLVELMH